MQKKWKQLKRKIIYSTKFLKVFEDTIELPDGTIIDDFSVVQKKDIVMVVATNSIDEILCITEYKYAVDECLLSLPAGQVDAQEDIVHASIRELKEETGYVGKDVKYMGKIYDYPTKDAHSVYVVKVDNVEKGSEQMLESTESILHLEFVSKEKIKRMVLNNEIKISEVIGALTLCGFLS